MIVKVKYFGVPIAFLTSKVQEIELPTEAAIQQLIESIGTKLNDMDYELLKESQFMVNHIKAEKDTVLKEGDEVIIMHALGGG